MPNSEIRKGKNIYLKNKGIHEQRKKSKEKKVKKTSIENLASQKEKKPK